MKPNDHTELLTTLRDLANGAATILDIFLKLREGVPPRAEAPSPTPEQAEAPTPTPEQAEAPTPTPHQAEAPTPTPEAIRTDLSPNLDRNVEFRMTDCTAPASGRSPGRLTHPPIAGCRDCGYPLSDPAATPSSTCQLCTLEVALVVERYRRNEAARSLAQSVSVHIGELVQLAGAATHTTEGYRMLPHLDAELSWIVHAFRECTGPFARPTFASSFSRDPTASGTP
jgi:hypothetical protein